LKNPIYNPDSIESINDRKIIGGNPTGIFELNKLKYQWAFKLWELMMSNTWFPSEVDMSIDKKDYKTLTANEKSSYDKALAQLIFMDSVQTNNLVNNINPYITAPEINLCLIRQAFEESLHSQSYAVMVDSITDNSDSIYELWRTDDILALKNERIATVYQTLANAPTTENLIKAMFANQILEGIYFYSGFAYIYSLARSGKMIGSSNMIKFIQRDEVTHLVLFQNMIKAVKREGVFSFTGKFLDDIYKLFDDSVQLEIQWGKYITGGRCLGLTDNIIESYIKYLADVRLKAVGLDKLYNINNNPLKWIDDYSNINSQKSNFFESDSSSYSRNSLVVDF
jgi:ribonucleoside-diphosphate reductase beta chain